MMNGTAKGYSPQFFEKLGEKKIISMTFFTCLVIVGFGLAWFLASQSDQGSFEINDSNGCFGFLFLSAIGAFILYTCTN